MVLFSQMLPTLFLEIDLGAWEQRCQKIARSSSRLPVHLSSHFSEQCSSHLLFIDGGQQKTIRS